MKDILQPWNMLSTPINSPKRAIKLQAITPLWSDKQSKSKASAGDWLSVL